MKWKNNKSKRNLKNETKNAKNKFSFLTNKRFFYAVSATVAVLSFSIGIAGVCLYVSSSNNNNYNNTSTGNNTGGGSGSTTSPFSPDSGAGSTNPFYQGGDESSSSSSLSYNDSSKASYWISERSLSLLFVYSTGTNTGQQQNSTSYAAQAGTGWIYYADQSTYTFYIATNLHVANILSFAGKTVTAYDEDNEDFSQTTYGSTLYAYVGMVEDVSSDSNNYSNTIVYFQVSTPTVVYTTISDDSYNSVMNKTTKQYYGYGENDITNSGYTTQYSNPSTQYEGISDIAILKYTINPTDFSTSSSSSSSMPSITTNTEFTIGSSQKNQLPTSEEETYIKDFTTWINNYFDNPTKVYDGYMENLEITDTTKFYMGGFPCYDSSTESTGDSISEISWLSFSDFTIYGDTTVYYPGNDYLTKNNQDTTIGYETPIAYVDSSSVSTDYTDYNYISVGALSLLEADSFSGSSGSPIVIDDGEGGYEIVGIYWGGITYSSGNGYYGNSTVEKGIMTWFGTDSYQLGSDDNVSYNIASDIDSVIGDDSN